MSYCYFLSKTPLCHSTLRYGKGVRYFLGYEAGTNPLKFTNSYARATASSSGGSTSSK